MIDTIETAAQHLVQARRAGVPGPGLPESCLPMDQETALAVQQRVTELLGETIGAWKCSVPKPDKTLVAPIYSSTIFRTSPCWLPFAGPAARVEPEIAFVMGRALPPRSTPYSESEIRDAIAEAHLVIEVLGSRYAEPKARTYQENLADLVQNLGMFVGPAIAGVAYPDLPSAFALTIATPAGVLVAREGKHPDGHPLAPLYWAANFLAGRGTGLKAGDVVTTGSYAGVIDVPLDTPLRFTYGTFGEIAVSFARK